MIKVDLIPKMWVYHQKECEKGKIVREEEGLSLLAGNRGWVKTPNDFDDTESESDGEVESVKKRGRPPKDTSDNVPHETK